ncbi:hypothetical protein [Streptomyces sp. NPDC001508]|uniref:hypothetical protein n=1 Tax=Streptomyces sp. NPDC001508 TaxID=3154656 RepID=UPI00332FD211
MAVGRCGGGRRVRRAPETRPRAPSRIRWDRPPGLLVALLLPLVAGVGCACTLGLGRRFARAVPEAPRGRGMTVLSAGPMTVQGAGTAPAGVAAGVRATVAGAGAPGAVCCRGPAVAYRAAESRDGADRHMTGR